MLRERQPRPGGFWQSDSAFSAGVAPYMQRTVKQATEILIDR